jgi:CDP-paratose 2-epimerase
MKVLIIGGAGFIGANAADYFARNDSAVVILDNFSRDGSRINAAWLQDTHPSIKVMHADIRSDHGALRSAIQDVDLILHEAAQVAVTTSVADPRADFDINVLGTFNVLEALRAVNDGQILMYASTNKVYGGLEHIDVIEKAGRYEFAARDSGISEGENLDFHSPYGCSKGAAEQYVRDYSRIYGLRTVVFRQSCIYGPHQFGVEDQGWVAWFSICASLGRAVTVYGDGRQIRDVLYVRDLIEAYRLAYESIARTSGQIYNLGGGPRNTLSLLELIRLLDRRYGRTLNSSFSDWRPGDQRVFVSGIEKAKLDFGWQPQTTAEDGVGSLCDWIDANPNLFATRSLLAV